MTVWYFLVTNPPFFRENPQLLWNDGEQLLALSVSIALDLILLIYVFSGRVPPSLMAVVFFGFLYDSFL